MAKSFNVSIKGVDAVVKKFDRLSGEKVSTELERVTETYARKMANESAAQAPRLTGQLKNSIVSSPRAMDGKRGVWQWGSNLAYAQRQEYEHKSHKGFIRKSVWSNRDLYRKAIRQRIVDLGKK